MRVTRLDEEGEVRRLWVDRHLYRDGRWEMYIDVPCVRTDRHEYTERMKARGPVLYRDMKCTDSPTVLHFVI